MLDRRLIILFIMVDLCELQFIVSFEEHYCMVIHHSITMVAEIDPEIIFSGLFMLKQEFYVVLE